MTTIKTSVKINAPKEKVWEVLWSETSYKKWAAVFEEGSYAESDWEEGSKIKFLTPKGVGMYGIIKKKVPFEQMIFEHHGEIKNGMEEPKEWEGITESYDLAERQGVTELKVAMDIMEAYEEYFRTTFPRALEAVKQISEQ